jgi:hypothetical protein
VGLATFDKARNGMKAGIASTFAKPDAYLPKLHV